MSFSAQFERVWQKVRDYRESAYRTVDDILIDPTDPSLARIFWANGFGSGNALDEELLTRSEKTKSQFFMGKLFAVVPVYVTSICSERCLYCNFRFENQRVEIDRLRLSSDQLVSEVRYLVEQKGLHVIELVYASDPLIRIRRMCQDVERIQTFLANHGGGAVGINAEAFDERDYHQLKNAGVNFAVLWQETYDKQRYERLHPGSTKKTNFEYRLDAFDRMLTAGIEAFGMGVLSGISDWRVDWAMMMEHETYLSDTYQVRPAILGVPRLKAAEGALLQRSLETPSRQEFKCAVALHNLFSPSTMPFINTREKLQLCREMSAGGGALFTFNCSTIPGGYAAGTIGYQFPTSSYDAPVFAPALSRIGLKPIFHWQFRGNQPSISEKCKLEVPRQ